MGRRSRSGLDEDWTEPADCEIGGEDTEVVETDESQRRDLLVRAGAARREIERLAEERRLRGDITEVFDDFDD